MTQSPPRLSPGQEFVRAYQSDGNRAHVDFPYTITDAFQPTKDRPRVTVRNLLKTRTIHDESGEFWCESRPGREQAARVHESELRQEAAFLFGVDTATLEPTTAWVQIPEQLLEDEAALAIFIDYRLIVRLCTAENQALTIGPRGVLAHPAITRLHYADDFISGVMRACDQIEQNGGTAHAMVINPSDYWRHIAGHGSLLRDLERNGTLISRTRMIGAGCALVGDFAVAATLLDGGRSVVRFAQPPEGTFATQGLAVCGQIYEALAIHLPTHFFYTEPAG